MTALLAGLAFLPFGPQPGASVVVDGVSRKVVAFHGVPLNVAYGGAIGIPTLLARKNHGGDLRPSAFWHDLVTASRTSKEAFSRGNPRVVIGLDDGRRIVVDTRARFVIVPSDLASLWDWRGKVWELTGPQAVDLMAEIARVGETGG